MKFKFKGLLLVVAMLILAVALVGCGGAKDSGGGSAQPQEEPKKVKTIRISNGVNDKHPAYLSGLEFGKYLESKTDAFKVEVYHSGQLGDDRTAMEALQLGTLEMVLTSTSPLANFIPEYMIFDFPFIFENGEIADFVLDGPFGQQMLDKLPAQGLIGLGFNENGFRNLTNSRRAVASVKDLEGLKIRTMENKVHLDAWRALGANPTPMAFTELFTAMQQRTVDGQENPLITIELSKFYEVQDHVSITNHVYTPFVYLMSKVFWDGLTAEEQALIKEAAAHANDWQRKEIRKQEQNSLASLEANGMTITYLSDEARAEFQDAVKPVIEKYTAEVGEELVAQLFEQIEKARQQ
ncbi:TRAP transporter substrate-binding protein [Desulfitibacter alkalitolerans]|uniref:TRAP transporter substrate-binding protein n=1 Tax=Desulfitibacter alkalitolerans TaxID=264641 RepID=UPI000485AA6C|nr:TRAP transporter substrate-binding protein [Desulfitibacter alkalitolerans]